jgi:quinol monooxygenase YgiN
MPRLYARAIALCGGLLAALFGLASCRIATPFRFNQQPPQAPPPQSESFRDARGSIADPKTPPTVVVAVTHAILDPANRREFDRQSRLVIDSLPSHPGHIGHSVATRILGNEVWTLTVWTDAASLDAFVSSPVHTQAIRSGLPAVISARFLTTSWPADQVPPPWKEIDRRLADITPVEYRARSPQGDTYPRMRPSQPGQR